MVQPTYISLLFHTIDTTLHSVRVGLEKLDTIQDSILYTNNIYSYTEHFVPKEVASLWIIKVQPAGFYGRTH